MHDFGDYGGVGVQRPIFEAGGMPVMLAQLPEAVEPMLERLEGCCSLRAATSTRFTTVNSRIRCWLRPSPGATTSSSS